MTWARTLSLSGRTVDRGPALGMVSAQAPGEGSLDDRDHTPTPQAWEHRCQESQTKENSLLIREGRERSPLIPARSLGSEGRGARTSGAVQ